jgi:hypothetical protein
MAYPAMYGRRILLRNCGRFLHVSADFGSEYTTHAHLSVEMLYAGLTREQSRKPRAFRAAMGAYRFTDDFDLATLPLWCTVGVPVERRDTELDEDSDSAPARVRRDRHTFNSMLEGMPGVQTNDRLPKYGWMETVLPDHRFATIALSTDPRQLGFERGQVFWMGKKRTMFQITNVGELRTGAWRHGSCESPVIQIGPSDVPLFETMQVVAATQRCLVVRGRLTSVDYLQVGSETVPALALTPLLNLAAA